MSEGDLPDGDAQDASLDAALLVDAGPPPPWSPGGWDLDATEAETLCMPYHGNLNVFEMAVRGGDLFVLQLVFHNAFAFGSGGESGGSLHTRSDGRWRTWLSVPGDGGDVPALLSHVEEGPLWLGGRWVTEDVGCALYEVAGPVEEPADCLVAEGHFIGVLPDPAADGAGWLLSDRALTRRAADGTLTVAHTVESSSQARAVVAEGGRVFMLTTHGVWAGGVDTPFEALFPLADEPTYERIALDREGGLWLSASPQRLERYDGAGTRRTEVTGLPGFVQALWVDGEGTPYFISRHQFGRVRDGEVEVLAELDPERAEDGQRFAALTGDVASGAVYLGMSDPAVLPHGCNLAVVLRYDSAGFTRL